MLCPRASAKQLNADGGPVPTKGFARPGSGVPRKGSAALWAVIGFRFHRLPWLPALAGTYLVFSELVPRLAAPGSAFDEGFALTYGDQVLRGAVPGRDFMTFYGPLNPLTFASLFAVAGHSLETERILGLIYRLAVVAGILWLLRRQPAAAALIVTLGFAVLYRGEGLFALASWGAVALIVLAVVSADAERPMLTGAIAIAVVLMRVDYVIAALGAVAPYVASWNSEQRRRFTASSFVGVALLTAWLGLIGPSRLSRLWAQLRISEPGRHLPLPSPFIFPGNVLALACAATCLLVFRGWITRYEREGRFSLALGLACLGLLPSTIQRPDAPHIVVFASLTAPLFPVVLHAVHGRAKGFTSIAPWMGLLLSRGLVVLTAGFLGLNLFVGAAAALPPGVPTKSFVVRIDGRSFRLGNSELAFAYQASLELLDALARPGQTVFVGPQDLRRTNINDAFVYFLLPRLRPSSYYIELDPHVTTVKASGFLSQLAKADFLVLSSDWDTWTEPNTNRLFDSSTANSLVRDRFCLRGVFGPVKVLQNCRLSPERGASSAHG